MQLTRQTRGTESRQEGLQVSAAHAVDVELGSLQRAQQSLLGALEEVQSLDGSIALALWLGEPREVTLAVGDVLDGREDSR